MNMSYAGVAAIHAVVTLMMAGAIWIVQIVHYPLFARVDAGEFVEYQRGHARRIVQVVVPLMIAEGATAVALLFGSRDPAARALAGAGAVLLAVIWASTALLQVPCHRRLARGFDAAAHRRLVRTNWIRTVAWSLRGVVALALWGVLSG